MRRFYSEVTLEARPQGIALLLDGRPVRTPAKELFLAPNAAVAEAAAAEWRDQGERIRTADMPVTRFVNSVIDHVAPQRQEIADRIAAYGGTDLLCYRAEAPEALVVRQRELWDPPLAWIADAHGIRLEVTQGIRPIAQDPAMLARLTARIAALDPWRLAGLESATTVCGSVVLGLALLEGAIDAEAAFAAAMLDEDHQAAIWGIDAEAARRRGQLRRELDETVRWLDLLAG
ncbi:MAG: ATPase [Alphaproteobacteria bacterium]|nr:MAG: ATPase [Alphaproteobacteria bacterium]